MFCSTDWAQYGWAVQVADGYQLLRRRLSGCDKSGAHHVKVSRPDGTIERKIGSEGRSDGRLSFPLDVCVVANDNVLLVDAPVAFANSVAMARLSTGSTGLASAEASSSRFVDCACSAMVTS